LKRLIEFAVENEGLVARAELMDDQAPCTCQIVWDMLPVTGFFHHACYSGSELAMVLPNYIERDFENATTTFLPWEIGFASLKHRDYFDVEQDFSEICFFYDRNRGPRMLDGPVKVNLFARFVSGQEELFSLCRRMRKEGQKQFTIRRVE
jgi:Protein of unknown function (DUF3830)